jgi:uncharacterized membrane protein
MRSLLSTPERLFLWLAIPTGLILSLLIPPFGGGDEQRHYHRTAEIAYGQSLSRTSHLPAGIVAFRKHAFTLYFENHPDGYSRREFDALAAIPLAADRLDTLQMNIFTVHHPINYAAQALAFRLAASAGVRPLGLMYVARIAGTLIGILLLWLAIRVTPSQHYSMAAIALLPTIAASRSTINADAITIGLALLFTALTLRAVQRTAPIARGEVFILALAALGIASAKGAYIPMALLPLAIPGIRFQSPHHRITTLAACILPAIAGGLGWMLLVKSFLFSGFEYRTLAGTPMPDQQLAFILHDPIGYVRVIFHTLFETSFLLSSLQGLLGEFSHSNVIFPEWAYWSVGTLGVATVLLDEKDPLRSYRAPTRAFALGIFVICFAGAITLLYVQWSPVRAPVISGFQGRYFAPVLPLLVLAMRPPLQARATSTGAALIATSVVGLALTVYAILVALYRY